MWKWMRKIAFSGISLAIVIALIDHKNSERMFDQRIRFLDYIAKTEEDFLRPASCKAIGYANETTDDYILYYKDDLIGKLSIERGAFFSKESKRSSSPLCYVFDKEKRCLYIGSHCKTYRYNVSSKTELRKKLLELSHK